ncbi:MAG TPA: TetR family transcriptional regulator [Dongiaceae bacterium]|nr:TetR family transcriptional regulator [Dongiaceae bacterium]
MAKAPRRRRGRDRVAALMAAARAVFLEKGTEAATMTEIAAQAGAAIGSLYQFFPTKEALAEAVHLEEAEAMLASLAALRTAMAERPGRRPDAGALADRLFRLMVDFLDAHPVFIVLADRRSIDPKRKQAVRRRLRGEVAALFALAEPKVAPARIEAMAVLIPHLMRVVVALRGESELANRARVIDELRAMLVAHLGPKANGRD